VGVLKVSDALLEVAHVFDRCLGGVSRVNMSPSSGNMYLENCQLVHLLTSASRYHVLKYTELLVHLRPSPSLDQAVCRLPRNLPSCSSSVTCLLPLGTIGGSSRSFRILGLRRGSLGRLLRILGLHLDDLAGPGGRRRKGVVILCNDALLSSGT
jgi:hypothetical protein